MNSGSIFYLIDSGSVTSKGGCNLLESNANMKLTKKDAAVNLGKYKNNFS
jgi:hypothetical protein